MFDSLLKSLAMPVEALLALYLHCVTVSEPPHHAPRFSCFEAPPRFALPSFSLYIACVL
jgi:hypothetical protein